MLGSSHGLQDKLVLALAAWNQIGMPHIDSVQVDGIRRMRYRTVSDVLGLAPNTLLAVDDFLLADRRLQDLPDRSMSRLSYAPQADGFATVHVAVVERSWQPHGLGEWVAKGLETGIEREVQDDLPGPSGEGGLWSGSWRWWQNRPRVALSFAAPHLGPLGGVWRVDASWERQAYSFDTFDPSDMFNQTRLHGGLTLSDWTSPKVRYSVSGGINRWQGPAPDNVRAAFVGAALERRWSMIGGAVGGNVTTWFAGGPSAFARMGVRGSYLSSPLLRGWVYSASTGIEHATSDAPFGLWPGAGEGHVSDLLLRAHPLLEDGVIRPGSDTIFARTVAYATARAERWIGWSVPLKDRARRLRGRGRCGGRHDSRRRDIELAHREAASRHRHRSPGTDSGSDRRPPRRLRARPSRRSQRDLDGVGILNGRPRRYRRRLACCFLAISSSDCAGGSVFRWAWMSANACDTPTGCSIVTWSASSLM